MKIHFWVMETHNVYKTYMQLFLDWSPPKGRGWEGHYIAKSDQYQSSNSHPSLWSQCGGSKQGLQISLQVGVLCHQFLGYINWNCWSEKSTWTLTSLLRITSHHRPRLFRECPAPTLPCRRAVCKSPSVRQKRVLLSDPAVIGPWGKH